MKKKIFQIFLVGLLVFSFTSFGLAKDKVIEWKVQGFVPAGMLFHETLVRMADKVKKATNGRLVFVVHPAGALVPPFEGIKAVSDGAYQAQYSYSAMWVGKIPVAPLFTASPGGLNVLGMQMWLNEGGGLKLWQETYDNYGFNVKIMPGPPIAMEDFMWSKKPLRKIEDFKGIKMRMMPLMGDVLQEHGMSVIFCPGGEIMPNLQRGVLDAAEYSIPAFDKTLGIWEICKYVMLPGIHQPASMTELLVNKEAYAALPDDLKGALDAAIAQSRLDEWLWMEKENIKAVKFLKDKGITWVTMDPETITTMQKWANEYLDKRSAKDKNFAKVWNSIQAFSKTWYPYHNLYNLPH
jgi:TRAP-type mannitol/chloroaromatic compound transport system substrate-binding protein